MTKNSYGLRFISPRLPAIVGFGAILVLLVGFGTWSAFTQIDGAIVAPGRVIVDRNRQAVQHPDGGVVQRVLVTEGQRVAKGEVLMELDPTMSSAELRAVEGQLAEVLARRGRLEAERDDRDTITFEPDLLQQAAVDASVARYIDGQQRLHVMGLESLKQEISQLNLQKDQLNTKIKGIDAQLSALERQSTLLSEELADQRILLDKGLAQLTRVRSLEREEARLLGMNGQMIASRAETMERISEISVQVLRLQTQRRQESLTTLRDLEMTQLQLVQKRDSLKVLLARMEIRAPVAGVIYDLRVLGPQSVVRPADPLMFIVPQDRPLVIEARVRPINVNSVHVSQDVVVRFPAFDLRQTPDLIGRVIQVSPDAFVDDGSGDTYYRAEVELAETEIAKLRKDQVIIPGMPVDSFFRTGVHTPLAYLLAPLTRYFGTALRDSG